MSPPPDQPPGAAPPPLRHIFRADLRSLAAFRIAIALVMICDLCVRACDLEAHYTDAGVLPRRVLAEYFLVSHPYLSLHTLNGTAPFQALLFMVAAVFAIALLLGYRTSAATIACWLLTCSLHARNPLVLHGGDDALRMLLFWAMFVPLGARWSIDRARATQIDSDADGVCSWGTAGLMLQLCFIYLFSSAIKTHASWRHDGTAVYLALSIDQFTTPLGRLLLPYHGLLKALTFATLAFEMAGPFLALFSYESAKVRTLTVAAFIGFHVGLGLCIELGIFPAVCIAAWLTFLPGSFWDALERRIRAFVRYTPTTQTDFQPLSPPGLGGRGAETSNANSPAVCRSVDKRTARPLRIYLSRAGNAAAASALFFILIWNLRGGDFHQLSQALPLPLDKIGQAARIDQHWNLFAPYPSLVHGWYVLDARLQNGEEVDILTGKPISWEKPPLVSATYRNERWRKYLMNLSMDEFRIYRQFYADYLQRAWNRSHTASQHLAHLEIVFVQETALPNYRLSPRRQLKLWRQDWPP